MKTCWLRRLLSLTLILIACAGFGVEGTGARAVLQASGKVQVNGNASRRTTTLFSGDVVETDEGSAANIIAGGSSVLVMSDTALKFLGNGVELTQGGMAIATSEAMTATVDGLTITPAAQKFSKFEVAEDDDTVVIAARQGNVAVSDGQQTSTVQEGQETKRKKKKKGGGAIPAGSGHAISGKTLAIVGGAAGGTVAGILIAEKGKQKCLSASGNKKCVCHKKTDNVDVCEIEN
jgi:ribosome-associated protein YbcJ (S4-like RNA binding protein)